MDGASGFNDSKNDCEQILADWFDDALLSNLELPPLFDDFVLDLPGIKKPSFYVSYDDCAHLQEEYPWERLLGCPDQFDNMGFPTWLGTVTSIYSKEPIEDATIKHESDQMVRDCEKARVIVEDMGYLHLVKSAEEEALNFNCSTSSNGFLISSDVKKKASTIDFEGVSKYFYMPIMVAAKEMKVGVTLLKKRCRELGIERWPHRKMKSLDSVIRYFQEMKTCDAEVMELIEMLKEHKRLMERIPDTQLTEATKKLRQACFKAKFKKKKLMALAASQ